MFFVKLELNRKTTARKIEFGRRVIAKLTDNVNFPEVNPPLDDIIIATNELEIAMINAHNGDTEKIALRNEKELVFDALIRTLSAYVQMESQGKKAVILSAGMEVNKKPEPIGDLPPPENLTIVNGQQSGTVGLKWSRVSGARSYVVKMTTTPGIPDSYTQLGISTAARFTVEGLERGKDYWFIIAAVGAAGMSKFSSPATIMAT